MIFNRTNGATTTIVWSQQKSHPLRAYTKEERTHMNTIAQPSASSEQEELYMNMSADPAKSDIGEAMYGNVSFQCHEEKAGREG